MAVDQPAAAPPAAPPADPSPPPGRGRARSWAIRIYVICVLLGGLAGSVHVGLQEVPTVAWTSWDTSSSYMLAVLLFAGELRSLTLVRHRGEASGVTISTTFAIGLAVVGPVTLALAVQCAAVVFDDLSRRNVSAIRLSFNVGQYLVTILGTRAVFAVTSAHDFLEPRTALSPPDTVPVLLAAATYFVVNQTAVAVIMSLHSGQNVFSVLGEDVRVHGGASAILLGLSPLAAIAAGFSALTLPLLLLPLLGVEHNAWMAARREHEALHDGLTGLPNRELFRVRAEEAMAGAAGSGGFAVMLLDLDHFKEVNDTLGHHVGDDLLRQIAGRLTHRIPDGVTVARLGGDEFAVLVPDVDDLSYPRRLAEELHDRLREPVIAHGVRIGVHASIGIAVHPDDAPSVELLLQRADIALYRAKENRGEFQFYRPEIDQHTVQRLSLLGDLHAAVERDEFETHYQPQVDAATGELVGVEALLRWRHPAHGVVPPDVFIPLAENTGAIAPITKEVMRSALATLAALRADGRDLGMAVNLSARLLSNLELPAWLGEMLLTAGVPASRLTIEVTESAIIADPKRAMEVLDGLRETGVRLSVDDFGTGYSSLSHLRRLQPDELKVDRSFVLQMLQDENSAVIVRSTVELGHALGLSVVAEGVEDEATYTALRELGCDRIQGFLVAEPMNSGALRGWVEAAATATWRTGHGAAVPTGVRALSAAGAEGAPA